MVFHWSLSDIKSPQIPRTLLSILADLQKYCSLKSPLVLLFPSPPVSLSILWWLYPATNLQVVITLFLLIIIWQKYLKRRIYISNLFVLKCLLGALTILTFICISNEIYMIIWQIYLKPNHYVQFIIMKQLCLCGGVRLAQRGYILALGGDLWYLRTSRHRVLQVATLLNEQSLTWWSIDQQHFGSYWSRRAGGDDLYDQSSGHVKP